MEFGVTSLRQFELETVEMRVSITRVNASTKAAVFRRQYRGLEGLAANLGVMQALSRTTKHRNFNQSGDDSMEQFQ